MLCASGVPWGRVVPKPGSEGVLAAAPKLLVLQVRDLGKAEVEALSWVTHWVIHGLEGEPGWPGPITSFFLAKCHLNI